jgi:hypothetical protein
VEIISEDQNTRRTLREVMRRQILWRSYIDKGMLHGV